MKKFTSLLLLLLVCFVGGVNFAYADNDARWTGKYISSVSDAVTSLDQLENGYYLMHHVGHGSFIREETTHQLWGRLTVSGDITLDNITSAFVGSDKSLMSSVVLITKNPNNTYKMQFSSGQYLGRTIGNRSVVASSNATAGDLQIASNGTGTFALRPVGQRWADCNGTSSKAEGSFTCWSEGNAVPTSANSSFKFYPVKLASSTTNTDYVTITVNAKLNGEVIATTTTDMEIGSTYSGDPFANVEKSYFLTTSSLSDQVVSETNKTFEVTVTEGTAPFTFSTAENPVWYTIHFRGDQNHYLCHVLPTDNGIGSARKFTSDFFNEANSGGYRSFNGALWAFVRDGFGVNLLCKQTGTYVQLPATGNATVAALSSSYPTTLTVQTSSYTQNGFSLKIPNVDKAFLGDHNNNRLAIWSQSGYDTQNDNGSCFQISPAETSDIVNIGKASMTANSFEVKSSDTYVVAASALNREKALPTIQTAANAATTLAELDAAYAQWDELKRKVYIPTDGYYRIKSAKANENQNAFISSEDINVGTDGSLQTAWNADGTMNRNVHRMSASDNFVAQIWKFEQVGDDTYYVRNANNNRLFSSGSTIDMPVEQYEDGGKGVYSFKAFPDQTSLGEINDGFSIYQMLCGTHSLNAWGGVTESNKNVGQYDNHDGDLGNYWQIIKVTSIPVTIRETGWTSVCYPFEVTIPTSSSVKAYYAGNPSESSLQLTEVENGVIPANTGVFLVNEDGETTVNLTITSTGATVPDGVNLLQGATAQRKGFTAGDTYLLGLNSAEEPALLKSELVRVPANKAYLPASALTNGTSVLSLTFGPNTGIDDATTTATEQNETYYDLNGRVVLYPQHGIFVTKSGRKVYVK